MTDHVRNREGEKLAIDDRVILDDKVHGVVDGYYLASDGSLYVVFKSDNKMSRTVWGAMPLRSDKAEHGANEEMDTEIFAFSLMIVHASNLRLETPPDGD